ncbi:MAG: hypothetical protein KDD64_09240 [Bdellovibrionales bacterium]|nr:hypothetical protein [Bdellovibrionales bacterium]
MSQCTSLISAILLSLSLVASSGCSTADTESKKVPRVNRIAHSQLPPAPTYNRLRWVHAPETLPVRELQYQTAGIDQRPLLLPVIHFEIQDKSLREASQVLAAATRYGVYCSSLVAERKVTLNSLGTVDELAAEISQQTETRVVVDHSNKEIRVLSGKVSEERFFEGEEGEQ